MLFSKYIMMLLQEAYDNIHVVCNSNANIIISCCYKWFQTNVTEMA